MTVIRTVARIGALVLLLSGAAVFAQGVAWDDLSEAQKELLAAQQQGWDRMDPTRQAQIARGAERYLQMNRSQRRQAQQRFAEWQELPEDRRAEVRRSYETFRRLDDSDRRRIRQAYRAYRRMPTDRRDELRRRFGELTPDQQRQSLRNRPLRQPVVPNRRPPNRR